MPFIMKAATMVVYQSTDQINWYPTMRNEVPLEILDPAVLGNLVDTESIASVDGVVWWAARRADTLMVES
ncbi:MAG: hypothetical protein E4H01_00705 [Lysobacterales bacterium]|nr:MAG: hypothetical protein E4H01_00705 [Xanthomonadales bacterium]